MRFRTGLNLIDLTAEVSRRLEHVKFPFLIMHDPGDSEFLFFIASLEVLPLAAIRLNSGLRNVKRVRKRTGLV